MKVIFCMDSMGLGGAEKSTLDILSHFSKDTDKTLVYFFPNHTLREGFEKSGVRLHAIPFTSQLAALRCIYRLYRFLRSEKPDVVVSSIMTADLITRISAWCAGVPLVGTFINDTYSDIRLAELRDSGVYWKFKWVWWMDRFTAGIPRYWISNARAIAESNARALRLPPGRIRVIHRGRDTSVMQAWSPPSSGTPFRFVFLGRLMKRKGLDELLEAFARLRRTHRDVRLDIIGDGEYAEPVQSQIQTLALGDSVVMHGAVPGGWRLFYEAHCFVFPSWYEGFSGTLVEAMILGIPTICSDISMNLEAVDASRALIFPVRDPEALCRCMRQMMEQYPEQVQRGANARTRAVDTYDIHHIALQYESFLREVADHKVQTTLLI